MVRLFIIHHDCGHGSFFKSRRANDVWGFITGVLNFTPSQHWRWEHAVHHSSSGNLDRRGMGDIWTLTVQECLECSRWKRFVYRLVRNPGVLFVLAPLYMFLIKHRFPKARAGRRERQSVYWTNLGILGLGDGLSLVFGLEAYLVIHLTALVLAGSAGVWLFYVQYQFEGVYWQRNDQWDYLTAALQGSSYYKLPGILRWFSGNIGFHHIHHLSPRILNYNLERCHNAEPLFQSVPPVERYWAASDPSPFASGTRSGIVWLASVIFEISVRVTPHSQRFRRGRPTLRQTNNFPPLRPSEELAIR